MNGSIAGGCEGRFLAVLLALVATVHSRLLTSNSTSGGCDDGTGSWHWPPQGVEADRQMHLRQLCKASASWPFCESPETNGTVPSFYVHKGLALKSDDMSEGLNKHRRKFSSPSADIYVYSIRSRDDIKAFLKLPTRSQMKPYVILSHGYTCDFKRVEKKRLKLSPQEYKECLGALVGLTKRVDVVLANMDLADQVSDSFSLLCSA